MKPIVLIVEDEDVFRETLAAIIRDEGYTVRSEPDAQRALKVLEQQPVNIVLTDVRMPGMSGIELMQKARCYADTDIIVMSAYASKQEAAEAKEKGAFDYLSKPFIVEEMLETLQRLCECRGHRAAPPGGGGTVFDKPVQPDPEAPPDGKRDSPGP